MPVRFQKKCTSGAHILVWEAMEDEVTLFADLPSSILTDAEYHAITHPKKRLEMLTSRLAIRTLASSIGVQFEGIKKDEHGKPYLYGSSFQMSITHSSKFMAVIMHPTHQVGIDIERPKEKMWRITERLFSPAEIKDIDHDLTNMSIYWSAKEALYKLYGKRSTDFRENLIIHKKDDGLYGEIIMPEYHHIHRLYTIPVDNYILVYAV